MRPAWFGAFVSPLLLACATSRTTPPQLTVIDLGTAPPASSTQPAPEASASSEDQRAALQKELDKLDMTVLGALGSNVPQASVIERASSSGDGPAAGPSGVTTTKGSAAQGLLPEGQTPTVPNVKIGAISIAGSTLPDLIAATLRKRVYGFRVCYREALKKYPLLEGRMTLELDVGKDDHVSQVRVQASTILGASNFEACIEAAAKDIVLPLANGSKPTITLPIGFARQEG